MTEETEEEVLLVKYYCILCGAEHFVPFDEIPEDDEEIICETCPE